MKIWSPIAPLLPCAWLLACLFLAGPVMAKEKSIFSPIIDVDAQRGFIFVSDSSGILIVQSSKAARPHLAKLPVGGMIDITVEVVPGRKTALLKSWKVVAGESDCKVFDGEKCK